MDRQDFLDGLDFHNDFILYQQVEPIPVVELEFAVVNNGYQLLGHYLEPGFAELIDKTYSVHALEKAWPQF